MEFYLRKVLRKCIFDMEEGLDPLEVIESLIQDRIMTVEDKEKLEVIESQSEKIRLFVSILEESGNAFHGFLDVLKRNRNDELVLKLQTLERSEKQTLAKNIDEILNFLGDTEQFIFCEMVCNIAQTMNKLQAGKLTKRYNFTEQECELTKGSEYPGFQVMKLLLGKGFFNAAHVEMLEDGFRELKLNTLINILRKFREVMHLPALVINVIFPEHYEISRENKVFFFETGKSLRSYFQNRFDVIFQDFTQQNTIIIRIPVISSLQSVFDGMRSGTIANELTPLIFNNHLPETLHVLRVECDEKDYTRVEKYLFQFAKRREEATSAVRESLFKSYLKNVGLREQYPSKMTLAMATKVRLLEKCSPDVKQSDIPFLFLTKLTALDCRVVLPELLNFNDSVRDFIWALLHCSDDFLKQHILEKLAACQIAVPIIIPKPAKGNPIFILWALRRIVKSFKNDESLTFERNMFTEPVFTVVFLRIGKLPVSKSHILNNMFGRAQNNATAVYFISEREDHQSDAVFSKGSLEAQWYVPLKGKNGEILERLTLFLNLRGDANNFPEQVAFASAVANMVFILINKANESQNIELMDRIKRFSSKVVVVALREKFQSQTLIYRPKLPDDNGRFEYDVQGENIILSQTLCEIIKMHCRTLKTEKFKCIQDWSSSCRSLRENIIIDEDNDSCQKAIKISKAVLEKLEPLTITEIKERAMMLQKLELEWVKLDHTKINQNESRSLQEDKIQREKSIVRKEQVSSGLTPEITGFYQALQKVTLSDDKKMLHYFMAHFQAQIDYMVKEETSPHISTLAYYEEELIAQKLKLKEETENYNKEPREEIIKGLQESIILESNEYINKHLGFEHFMRELCQLFEARVADPQNDYDETSQIATIGARLLLEGYPLEILSGNSANISINWISTILQIVDEKLHFPKIFVVSVIGAQSSGKSTLLNCMFGSRFTARAGKCTRGLFLQVLEVEDACKNDLGFQYLFIIDTEGFQSPDRTVQNDFKFDNTLGTLSMCIVDLSILNISQENIGPGMIGLLQIAAHALIRMKEVKLVSGFRIVHQKVSDLNAASENKSSMNIIKGALDKAAFAAAKEENITHIKEFSDVFPFRESDNLYIPSLWLGNMSPPNHAYSDNILNLKSKILSKEEEKGTVGGGIFTIRKFKSRLHDVWEALKEEDFVFNFQNSFNALSYQRFRLEHNRWVAVMRIAMVEWELNNKGNIKEGYKHVYELDLHEEVERHLEKVIMEIDEYVRMHSDEEEVIRQQNAFKSFAKSIAEDIEHTIQNNFNYYMTTKREKESLPNFIKNCKIELREKAKQKALEARRNYPSLDSQSSEGRLNQMFELLWNDTTEELKKTYENIKVREEAIVLACENSLHILIKNSQYNLKFNKIIGERGGRIVSEEIASPIQKQSKQGKMKLSRILASGSLSGKDRNEKDSSRRKQIETIAFRELNSFLEDESFEAFDKNRIDKLFTVLFQKLREFMQLEERYVLETLVFICNHVARQSIYKQHEFEGKYSLYKLMEAEKDGMRNDFFSDFDKTISTESVTEDVAARISSELRVIIRDKLIDHLNVKLLERLTKFNWFVDRQTLIGTILYEICNQESKEKYADFISNEDDFIIQWLQSREIEEIRKTEGSHLWIEREAHEKLSSLKDSIIRCLPTLEDYCPNSTVLESAGKLDKSMECNISHWQSVFIAKCKIEDLAINLEQSRVDIIHFMSLSELLRGKLKDVSLSNIQMKPNLESCNEPKNAKTLISKMEISPHHRILKQLKGCSEVCPFCNVGCHHQGEHSVHEAAFHYPQGLSGFRNRASQGLSVEVCTSLVASDSTYNIRSISKHGSYKKYRKDFATWNINPIRRDTPTKHWQWVMAQYIDYFADKYQCKPGVIPPGWRDITKQEALLSLKQSYNLVY